LWRVLPSDRNLALIVVFFYHRRISILFIYLTLDPMLHVNLGCCFFSKKDKITFAVLLLPLFYTALPAQITYEVQYLGLEYGLGDIDVLCAIQSRNGNLWVGTKNQLYRFDGIHTQVIGNDTNHAMHIPDPHVQSLAEDDEGHIWVGTNKGLAILDPVHQTTLEVSAHCPTLQPLFTDIHAVCNGDNKSLFFITTNDLYRYEKKEVKHVCALYPAMASRYYTGVQYHPVEKRIYFNGIGNKIYQIKNNEVSLLEGEGYLWSDQHKNWFPLSRITILRFPFLSDTMVLFADKNVVTKRVKKGDTYNYYSENIAELVFKPYGAVLEYLQKNSLAFPQSIVQDIRLQCAIPLMQPGEWCLGTAHGVFLVKEKKKLFHHIALTKGYSVRGILEHEDKSLWLGTYSGMLKYQNGDVTIKKGPDYDIIWDFYPVSKDSIWVFSESPSGVRLILNPNTPAERVHTPSFAYNLRFSKKFARTPRGFWVSSQTNLFGHLTHGADTPFFVTSQDTSSGGLVKTLHYSPRTGLWQGGADGLKNYPTDALGMMPNRVNARPLPPIFSAMVVNAIHEDPEGLIWVGTNNEGLIVYDPLRQKVVGHWTMTDGLPHNTVYSILSTQQDSVLWLGTENGICRFFKRSKQLQNYNDTDGLGQNEFNTGAIFQAKNGVCYFGGIDGVSWFDPAQISANVVNIEGCLDLEITNTARQTSRKELLYPGSSVQIQPDELMIEIKFRSNLLFRANDAMYRYRISGIHSDWRLVPLREKLVLVGLKPGDYLLEYQIRSASSGWSDLATTRIHILPHWYESTWFYASVGLLLSGLMYAFYRWRLSQLRKTYEFRKSVTDDLHDALGTRLYLLKVLAGKIVQHDRNVDQELLQKFEEQTKDALQSVRSFIWAFDPKNDTLAALYGRLTDFAENYLHPIVQHLQLHIDPANNHLRITPKTKHHVLQIYQETLTNIVKHTVAEKIEIRVFLNAPKSHLHLEIFNTHAGIKSDEPSDHQRKGKLSMQARATEIKAILEWEEPQPGLQITRIQIPLN
jgi:ligand-binding sensor domain-containing protein/signal transduction histidine kinase